jgi:hypothetical protein
MADMLWSIAVRDDWDNRCAVCGNSKCEAHHLIPRQHPKTRHDLQNGIALCANHHQFDADISPHQNAAGFVLWLQETYPGNAEWVFEMMDSGSHRNFEGTTNAFYYCDVIRDLKQYVDEQDYVRIVGKRFSAYLAAEEAIKGG